MGANDRISGLIRMSDDALGRAADGRDNPEYMLSQLEKAAAWVKEAIALGRLAALRAAYLNGRPIVDCALEGKEAKNER